MLAMLDSGKTLSASVLERGEGGWQRERRKGLRERERGKRDRGMGQRERGGGQRGGGV